MRLLWQKRLGWLPKTTQRRINGCRPSKLSTRRLRMVTLTLIYAIMHAELHMST
jgi:hypothetical protein